MTNPKTKRTYKKVTLNLPVDLLEKALRSSDSNITDTVRQGLELIAARWAYAGLQKYRGKVKFSLSLNEMRYDRS